tara:strand:- start:1528 stop:2130 length:603 start_codon:yes stop_codon:yes gene_type:complete
MIKRDLWFPTPVYWSQVDNYQELNKYLFKHIKAWHKKDKGVSKTNRGGWHSSTEMGRKAEYKPLIQELVKMQEFIIREEGYTHGTFLGNMWANINYPGSFNRTHMHPNSNWSGVYYIKVPDNSGLLHLEDPRHGSNMIFPKQLGLDKMPTRLWRQTNYTPIEGRLLMFPAFLAHHVDVNDSKKKGEKGWRVSVSFNFIQQ